MPPAVHVKGLAELNRAFSRYDRALGREVKDGLKDAARPVATRAQDLAISHIHNITNPWSEFRIGATSRVVYVAPRQRGTTDPLRRRPGFGLLLLERAMEPALADEEALVVHKLEGVLDDLADIWTFHG